MKKFAVLIILTAFGLLGTAFFGIYTAPGLEDLPTYKSLGIGKGKRVNLEAESEKSKKTFGVFPANTGGKTDQRNNYLKEQQQKIAPGS